MKEFTEKLIGRLKEEHEICINQYGAVGGNIPASIVKKCMAITNRLAEEYVPDTNVGNKDGWIPVEERLPEDKQQVLVTNWDHSVFPARYDENEERFIDIRNSFTLPLIFAWMPLPKPYREKGE